MAGKRALKSTAPGERIAGGTKEETHSSHHASIHGSTIVELKLNEITCDERTRLRAKPDRDGINELAAILKDDQAYRDPLDVFFDQKTGEYYLADGWKRVTAARLGGLETYPVRRHHGTLCDAVYFAIRANARGTKEYSAREKRVNIVTMLLNPLWEGKTSRPVAHHCGVSHTTVLNVVRGLKALGISFQINSSEVLVRRKGQTYRQKTRAKATTPVAVGARNLVPSTATSRQIVDALDKLAEREKKRKAQRANRLFKSGEALAAEIGVRRGSRYVGMNPDYPETKLSVICEDATNASAYQRLIEQGGAACLWTDPPYGCDYKGKRTTRDRIRNDKPQETRVVIEKSFLQIRQALSPGAAIYIARPGGVLGLPFQSNFVAQGWHYHQDLVWDKGRMIAGGCDYQFNHELILYGFNKGGEKRARYSKSDKARWFGSNSCTSILRVPAPNRSKLHPTMKPPELIKMCIKNSTTEGEIVLDPFAGSGSTLVAAAETGRGCYGIEYEPKYVAVILKRLHEECNISCYEVLPGGRRKKVEFK
ncbi:MAG: ParB N-terminal domain-containing protein [Rubrivivax sp.]|nr:ParB N-terminal domain-containing protein [Pyrinomonadaceae bacterium]